MKHIELGEQHGGIRGQWNVPILYEEHLKVEFPVIAPYDWNPPQPRDISVLAGYELTGADPSRYGEPDLDENGYPCHELFFMDEQHKLIVDSPPVPQYNARLRVYPDRRTAVVQRDDDLLKPEEMVANKTLVEAGIREELQS